MLSKAMGCQPGDIMFSSNATPAEEYAYAEKLGAIPTSWETALQRAERQEDTDRARVERVKLDAAGEIRAALAALWEEQP